VIQQIENKLTVFKEKLIRLKTLKDDKQNQLEKKVVECSALQDSITSLSRTIELLEQSNIVSREFVRVEVEKLVTQGLQIIFDDPYVKFNIDFVTKRNQIEAEFSLSRTNTDIKIQGDILSTYGGGVADIISTSLRIIMMQLMKLKGPLVLDEPGKNISIQFISNFGKFLTKIAETFERQIILITHNEVLAEFASSRIEVSQSNLISKVNIV